MSNSSEGVSIRPGKRSAEPAERSRGIKAIDKSTRVSHACELCREKRARCNGERPTCQRCAKLGTECQYGLAKNDRRRKEIEDLKRQVAEYEEVLDSVAPTFDGHTREKLTALRQDSHRSDLAPDPDSGLSPATYNVSGLASLQTRSPPELVYSGESSSSMSGSTGPPLRLTTAQVVSPFQPLSPPDQFSPKERKHSSGLSQRSTTSFANSVVEWQKGFIYTATEGVVPPRDVTERAVKAFFAGSTMLFELFETDEMDDIFRVVYETPPSPTRTIALCQLCLAAAVGCQYDWDQFPDDTAKSYLAVAKLYTEEIIETHALSAMRVMALLALYFSFEKRLSSLVYVDSGLSIARAQQVDIMTATPETRKWKRTWCSLMFLGSWISATVGRYDPTTHNFHLSMMNPGTSASVADVVQYEMCKVAHLTGRILRDVYHAPNVDTDVVNMYKAELESWRFSLPGFMRIDSLLTNGSNEIPVRPIFLVHLLYLSTMALIYRRVLSEFADRPECWISFSTMEDVSTHLDACLWSSRQVCRILSVAMSNGSVYRKCWMFIHATYCANNILLYFAANRLLHNPASDCIGEDMRASMQCMRTLEYCAVADESAQHFLRHVKPLHVALVQMHQISGTTAPRDVIPISSLITEYLETPRPNIPVGDDLAKLQRTVVSAIETLMRSPEERARLQNRPETSRRNSMSSYPDPETGMPIFYHSGDGERSAADCLRKYFQDDSRGHQAFKSAY